MLQVLLTNLVLPLAVDVVKLYVKNTESKKDDKVLEVVQTGASYLANKGNNSVLQSTAKSLRESSMRNAQDSK